MSTIPPFPKSKVFHHATMLQRQTGRRNINSNSRYASSSCIARPFVLSSLHSIVLVPQMTRSSLRDSRILGNHSCGRERAMQITQMDCWVFSRETFARLFSRDIYNLYDRADFNEDEYSFFRGKYTSA